MSRKEYVYWTHGVNTIVEHPERTQVMRHTGLGTIIEQDEDSSGQKNWFHLPIPTPSILRGDRAYVSRFTLEVWMNENVRISDIHVRMGRHLIADETPNQVGQDEDTKVNFGRSTWMQIDGGLSLSVKVEFLSGTPRGRIVFRGAAARFKKD